MTPVSSTGLPNTTLVSQGLKNLDLARRTAAVAGVIFYFINTQIAGALWLVAASLYFATHQTETLIEPLLNTIDSQNETINSLNNDKGTISALRRENADLNKKNKKLLAGNTKLEGRIHELNDQTEELRARLNNLSFQSTYQASYLQMM